MKPDYGPIEFKSTYGASCIGARYFLIAYNVNILGTKEQAHRIALNVREQGRSETEVYLNMFDVRNIRLKANYFFISQSPVAAKKLKLWVGFWKKKILHKLQRI